MGKSNKTSATTVVAQTIAFPRNQFPPLVISSVPLKNLMFLASYCGRQCFAHLTTPRTQGSHPLESLRKGKKPSRSSSPSVLDLNVFPPMASEELIRALCIWCMGATKGILCQSSHSMCCGQKYGSMPRTPRFCNIIDIHMYIAIYT